MVSMLRHEAEACTNETNRFLERKKMEISEHVTIGERGWQQGQGRTREITLRGSWEERTFIAMERIGNRKAMVVGVLDGETEERTGGVLGYIPQNTCECLG